MGLVHYLALLSFAYDVLAQVYAILSSPSMKDIHERNMSFWSPNPLLVGCFFTLQQVFQAIWLRKLWKLAGEERKKGKAADAEDGIAGYMPWYIGGNLCTGTWAFSWNANRLDLSNLFVIVNTFVQLGYLFIFLARPENRLNLHSRLSFFTHVVAKTFAGIAVLDVLHNSAAAYFVHQRPSFLTKALTGLGFGALALAPATDWIFGACLVYDLVALSVGQGQWGRDGGWSAVLGVYAVVVAGIVGARNWLRPPYVSKADDGYEAVQGQEGRM
ncbi:MAG: hypothetical protein M1821_000079 [Bathelium mastoideum]|nr:MAG: hypothetical protein M1821_000079 [Bathelium mastoideum]